MNPTKPPPLPQRKRTLRNVILILLLCVFGAVVFLAIVGTIVHNAMFSWLKQAAEMRFMSSDDTFRVTILEMKNEPGNFMEKIRIRCERDMKASIRVVDLKQAGMFEIIDANGEIYYHEGNSDKISYTMPVPADGDYSTCYVFFRVSTTSSNTVWHSQMSAAANNAVTSNDGSLDTTLPTPLEIGEIHTNWPGPYKRSSLIPLADLGSYKILVSIK